MNEALIQELKHWKTARLKMLLKKDKASHDENLRCAVDIGKILKNNHVKIDEI